MRRVITGILCCLLVILLMSHNVGAISLDYNVQYIRGKANSTIGYTGQNTYCRQASNSTSFYTTGICEFNNLIITTQYPEYLAGDILELDVIFVNTAENNSVDGYSYVVNAIANDNNGAVSLSVIGTDYEGLGSAASIAKTYVRVNQYTSSMQTISLQGSYKLFNNEGLSVNQSTWRYSAPDFSSINNNLQDVVDAIQDSASSNTEYQEAEQQAVENIENQTTNDTESELPDMSNATSLIGNIQNIFTQIGNIPASNCTIPANWGNLNLGNLNLCTGKENMPFVVTFGAYAFELIFVIGASIILVKQVVSMFDWARGDN